ncbi:hypothetical protein BDV29DRAFT_188672 [Aspergillus leporis]|uniref:Uncharacterized protein n=1 Tax=Aspergillus leporis TaxID=41062 RepID=A0A5N5XBF5_9EURO|nr:hypothetical protein BDV29DRAFT_188672 [Aspergillus leporis]
MLLPWLALLVASTTATDYDHIDVSEGTSGLVAANRPSEKPFVLALTSACSGTSPLDWTYETIPQAFGRNVQAMHAGKSLGAQKIGNDGRSWDDLFPYYMKQEDVSYPNHTQIEAGTTIDLMYHGFQGRVAGWSVINPTSASIGILANPGINSGSMRDFGLHPSTTDGQNVCSGAARAYYWPYSMRPNLCLNTLANRITATAMECEGQDNKKQVIRAKREIILAASALRCSAILEHSSASNPHILNKLGIPVHLDLPSVITLNNQNMTGTRIIMFVSASDIFGPSTESVVASVRSRLAEYTELSANQSNGAMKAGDLRKLFEVQYDLIFNHNISMTEFSLLPFARGNVHIVLTDTRVLPPVNPNFGILEWDVQVQIAMSKFLQRGYRTRPLKEVFANEALPGLEAVPPTEQSSMLPRSIADVGDIQLKAHRTANVRAVDASIQPMQLSGHPTGNLYAVAERVADFIKTYQARV